MKHRKDFVLLLIVASIISSLIACSAAPPEVAKENSSNGAKPTEAAVEAANQESAKPATQPVLAFANWNETNSFAVLVRKGFESAAQEHGARVILMDNKQDAQQANINADNAITQKVDFYFQYNQDTDINNRIAEKLKAASVKAIAIQVPMGDFPIYHVDNVYAGEIAGEAVAKAAKEKWEEQPIYLVIGQPEAGPLFQMRAEGAIKGAKSIFPDIEIVEDTSKGDPERTRALTADFLTAHPNQKIIIWAHVDQQVLAALSAVKSAGRTDDVLISGTGGDPSIFPELRNPDSIIVGTSAFFPEEWGKELVSAALKWLNEDVTPPEKSHPPTRLLTGENIDEFYPEN